MDKLVGQKWLKRAKDDLNWTEANIRESVWYGACFTAQQASEKALKAYLISKGKKAAKLHDLGVLLELCKETDQAFDGLKDACATLTDYYAPTRYPDIGEFMSFSRPAAVEAQKFAEKIITFVEERI